MEKKTQIICTIGPATESQEKLESLLKEGMDIMRLNFSHGDFEEHQVRVENFRKAGGKLIIQDLCGPKIRIGDFGDASINLVEGQEFILTTEHIHGDSTRVHINYEKLPEEVRPGQHVFIFDGRRKLEVLKVKGKEVVCKVLVGGELKSRKGVNLPESDLSIGALTPKDKRDLEFGITNGVDYFALSFVRQAGDVQELRDILAGRGSKAKIISKIETPQAIENIDEIIEKSDGVMVARGDLAIEAPFEKVPLYQKEIIKKCKKAGKFVIVATQILESMVHSPVPTRAEVSDIANAVLDGADALMLSEETTFGHYPIEAVKVMTRVAEEVENNYPSEYKTT